MVMMNKVGKKEKIGIVRGPGLSKWEMQIYEPLRFKYRLLGIGSNRPVNDVTDIRFPIRRLTCSSQRIAWMPGMIPIMYSLSGDTQWLAGFKDAVKECDLLHAVETRNGYSLQAVKAKQEGVVKAVTLTVYENIPFIGDQFPKRRKIKEEVIKGTDLFFAANRLAKETLIIEGVTENKIVIVPQSVDTDRFTPIKNLKVKTQDYRRKFGTEDNDFVVLSVGRMVWEKGWEDLIAAAARIFKSEQKIRFLFIGEGPELERYRKMVKRLGLEKIILFTGGFGYSEMPDIFRLADVFVYASLPTPVWNAQFGGVLIEAMASGLPVVGTLSGGTRETVGECGGIFVQTQDFSHLSEALIELSKNPQKCELMGKENRNLAVKKYDVKVVANTIASYWDKLLDSR
jgi:glycosyltransferase involved in cell wall biosynthesis